MAGCRFSRSVLSCDDVVPSCTDASCVSVSSNQTDCLLPITDRIQFFQSTITPRHSAALVVQLPKCQPPDEKTDALAPCQSHGPEPRSTHPPSYLYLHLSPKNPAETLNLGILNAQVANPSSGFVFFEPAPSGNLVLARYLARHL